MALFNPTDLFAYIGSDGRINRVDGTDVIDKGAWSPTIAYNSMEVVQYGNMLFVALVANFNMAPTAIVDDNWSSLVRTSGEQTPTLDEVYQVALSGSNLAYATWGSLQAGDFLPNQARVIQCSHVNWGTQGDQVNAGQMPYNTTYLTVKDALDAIFYTPLQITSFTNSVGVVELGVSVASASLAWTYNTSVISQSIDKLGVLTPSLRAATPPHAP